MIEIDGKRYSAVMVGAGEWIVHRGSKISYFGGMRTVWDETLINLDTLDERTAIEAAIARGSWA